MKKIFWYLLLLLASLQAVAQRDADYGIYAGVSSYMGDINPDRLFYAPLPAGGVFYRFNFNPRQALRTNLLLGGLRADDLDFNNGFQAARNARFSGSFLEWGLQYEFNFLPIISPGKQWDYTPYLAGGVGLSFISTDTYTYIPVIPFSVGVKINVYKNIGLEAEYGFRKTFYDNFDGVKDLVSPSDYAVLHNNDWYSFAGIAVTWKIYNKLAGCKAYSDEETKRKRR